MSFEKIKSNNEEIFYKSVENLKKYFTGKENYEWFLNEVNYLLKKISIDYELKNKLKKANYVSLIRLKEISGRGSIAEKIIRFSLLSEYLLNNEKRVVYFDREKWKKYFNKNELEDEVFSNFLESIKTKYDEKDTWKLKEMKEIFNSFYIVEEVNSLSNNTDYKPDETLERFYSLLDTKKVFEL